MTEQLFRAHSASDVLEIADETTYFVLKSSIVQIQSLRETGSNLNRFRNKNRS